MHRHRDLGRWWRSGGHQKFVGGRFEWPEQLVLPCLLVFLLLDPLSLPCGPSKMPHWLLVDCGLSARRAYLQVLLKVGHAPHGLEAGLWHEMHDPLSVQVCLSCALTKMLDMKCLLVLMRPG